MKQFLVSVALLGLPFWLPTGQEAAYAGEEKVFKVDAEAAGEENFVWVTAEASGENIPTGGWLGVQVGEVPEALAAQLGIDKQGGVLILNVVKDSPAEQAGLKVHDVIVSIGDTQVGGNVEQLANLIRSRDPGEVVGLVVLQNGEEATVKVQLSERPDDGKLHWIHVHEPNLEIEDRVKTRGRIIGKGPGGKVFIKDLGDLNEIEGLPEDLRVMVSTLDNQSTRVFVDGERKRVEIVRETDGTTLKVEEVDEGEITVTRTDEDGNETQAVYKSREQLQAADEEAFEALNSTTGNMLVELHPMGDDELDFDFDVDFDFDFDPEQFGEWRTEFEARLGEAREAMEQAKEEAAEAMREAMEKWDTGDLKLFHDLKGGHLFVPGSGAQLLKARHTFEVEADGTIKVRIRKGDTELLRTFANEDELRDRDPRLFEKYEKIMEADQAE
jgi:hypothetical protein